MAVTHAERVRLRFVFGGLAIVPLFLGGWFTWIQVLQKGDMKRPDGQRVALSAEAAAVQHRRTERLPSARGTIKDRHGSILAMDCDAFEVRAEVSTPKRARRDCAAMRTHFRDLARSLADALCRDEGLADRAAARAEHFQRLEKRLAEAFAIDKLPSAGPVPETFFWRREILVERGVAVLSVIEALEEFDRGADSVLLHMQHDHARVYPERQVTYGLVGYVEDEPVRNAAGKLLGFEARATAGLESVSSLLPGAPGEREFRVDAQNKRFFTGIGHAPSMPSLVESTIDLELQKAASRELERQAMAVSENDARRPLWGAMLLVEIESGDVLAAASWHRDVKHPRGAAFTPYQSLYEPGSIVKPLLFAYAHANCNLDWDRAYDCSSAGADHHCDVPEVGGRRVRDDHACGVLSSHGILVNSSNIGAVKVGSLLSRDDWARYLEVYGLRRSLELPMPNERQGHVASKGWLPGIKEPAFKKWTGSSYSIGYEHQVNALQMARAYLTMLSGHRRELRLVRAVEVDGKRIEQPVRRGEREFSDDTVQLVRAALGDVMSDDEGATGRHMVAAFRKEGTELVGLLAGKTGTAKSRTVIKGKGTVEVRNASFVGFMPAHAPRYLAVCVLQRDDSARFYGGSYAAPPAARLLLEAMRLEERRRPVQGSQVSATPGASGRGPLVAETGQAGR